MPRAQGPKKNQTKINSSMSSKGTKLYSLTASIVKIDFAFNWPGVWAELPIESTKQ